MGVLRGIRQLREFRAGKVLGRRDSIIAKCTECMGEYEDGARDCGQEQCPIHRFMPYLGKVRRQKGPPASGAPEKSQPSATEVVEAEESTEPEVSEAEEPVDTGSGEVEV